MDLRILVAWVLIAIFTGLSLVHVYWLCGGQVGQRVAIPEIDDQLVFQPSVLAPLVVAIGLMLCAVVIAGTSGILTLPMSQTMWTWMTRALAVIWLLRAIGDFRVAGFFKRVRGTRFARLDTLVYSPLCLTVAMGLTIVGFPGPG